ncbi:DUF1223 domain-containing protein [Methylopila sp. M107]|uniref:DUF1223 domain-containing protein n=1 Tax=Methylopila sp. M107 TaxID=1101190 RepID=UPI00039B97B6|nr:DUF1223 domain-containing protein [Methylopila sp. M107]
MRVSSLVFAGCLLALPASAQDAPSSVVELFTSQGCSSCPPADRLAGDLAGKGRSLVLTLPVDYWDYVGWKDTLANPANSARQRAYARVRGDRKVLTPQIVVNGAEATVGNDSLAVEAAIDRAEDSGGLSVPVALQLEDGRVEVEVSKAARPAPPRMAEVWAFAIERSRPVSIGGGENTGREVVYANVVRHMTRLGVWDGQAAHFEIAADEVLTRDADGVAVLVQAGNGGQPGRIVGAAVAALPQRPSAPAVTSSLADPY